LPVPSFFLCFYILLIISSNLNAIILLFFVAS